MGLNTLVRSAGSVLDFSLDPIKEINERRTLKQFRFCQANLTPCCGGFKVPVTLSFCNKCECIFLTINDVLQNNK